MTLAWLDSLLDREKLPAAAARVRSLDGARELLDRLGVSAPACPVVQVGGTKGKGATVLILEQLARAGGLRTCAYLSPHLERITERIRIDGAEIRRERLDQLLAVVRPAAEAMAARPSWFEALTAAALLAVREQRPDLLLLEVGIGGRLDATSAVPHTVSVITGIGLEHTQVLGDTIEQIAAEKAGLLRPARPCVTGATGAGLRVISERAAQVGAPLLRLGHEVRLADVRVLPDGFAARVEAPGMAALRLTTDLLARPQLDSLALALAALAAVCPGHGPAAGHLPLRRGLPARFEVLPLGEVPVVLDSAHTEESVRALFDDLLVRYPGRRVDLVFGSAVDKRWRAALSAVAARVDKAWVAPIDSPRTEAPAQLAEHLKRLGVPTTIARHGTNALALARAAAGPDAVIVVTGSAYLAGEVRTGLLSGGVQP